MAPGARCVTRPAAHGSVCCDSERHPFPGRLHHSLRKLRETPSSADGKLANAVIGLSRDTCDRTPCSSASPIMAQNDDELEPTMDRSRRQSSVRPSPSRIKLMQSVARSGGNPRALISAVPQPKRAPSGRYNARGRGAKVAANGGEYYTPRPLIRAIVQLIDPRIGERVYDPGGEDGGAVLHAAEPDAKALVLPARPRQSLGKTTALTDADLYVPVSATYRSSEPRA